MKKLYPILLAIFTGIQVWAQSVEFIYDNAGNRIKRLSATGGCTSPRDPEDPSGTTAGLNYRYFESAAGDNWCSTSSLNGQNPVKTGNVTNFSLAPRNRDEQFGFEYTGFLEAPVQGEYTFYLKSDDAGSFMIGNQTVVSYEGCHGMDPEQSGTICLKAGRHAIKLLLAQNGGGYGLEIGWSGPGISKQLVPDNRISRSGSCTPPSAPTISSNGTTVCTSPNQTVTLSCSSCSAGTVTWYKDGSQVATGSPYTINQPGNYTAKCVVSAGSCESPASAGILVSQAPGCGTGSGSGTGLTASYYNSMDMSGSPVLTRVDPVVDFQWGSNGPGSGVNTNFFSVRWQGQVEAPVSGTYTFKTYNDDGTRVWVNGQLLIDDWNGHPPTWAQGSISLTANQKYDIKIEFFDGGGGSQSQLFWEYPNQSQQVVPQSRLYPTGCTPPSAPSIALTQGTTACSSTPDNSVTLTATGCSGTVTWFRGGTQVATGSATHTTNIPGAYTATCTSGGCASGASNTVNVAQTSGCGGNPISLTLSIWRAGDSNTRTKIQDLNNGDNIPISALNGGQANWFIDIAGGQISSSPGTGNYNHVSLYLNGNGYSNQGWGPENVTNAGLPPYGLHGRNGGSYPPVGNNYQLTGKVFFNGSELASKTVTFNIVSCTPPSAPSISITQGSTACSSTPNNSVTLTATGCGGTVTWFRGGTQVATGSATHTTNIPGVYTATCTSGGCVSGVSNTVNVAQTSGCGTAPGNCYTLSFKGENPRYISNHNGIVKVKDADNSNSQIWKMEDDGSGYFRLVSQGSTNGTAIGYVLGTRSQGSSENTVVDLQAGTSGDHQLWSPTALTGEDASRYKIERKGTGYRISSNRNWGQGNLSDGESDLAILSDPGDVFGSNKWTFTSKTCPGSGSRLNLGAEGAFDAEQSSSGLTVAPNPSSGEFQASFSLTHNREATLSVIDMSGKTWYEKNVQGAGLQKETISLPLPASGVFIVLLKSQDGIISRKVIVTR